MKIESRPRRVLTIPGRLSSDLQAIVNPSAAPPVPFPRPLCLSRPVAARPPFVPLRSLPRPPPPRFLNPHRFRRCRLEFESTPQNRGVTKRSYVSPLPRRGCKGFAFPIPPRRTSQPADRSRREHAPAARIQRIFHATSRDKMFLSVSSMLLPVPLFCAVYFLAVTFHSSVRRIK